MEGEVRLDLVTEADSFDMMDSRESSDDPTISAPSLTKTDTSQGDPLFFAANNPLTSKRKGSLSMIINRDSNDDSSMSVTVLVNSHVQANSYAPDDEIKGNEMKGGKPAEEVEVVITNVTHNRLGLVLGQYSDAVCGGRPVARLVVQQLRKLKDGRDGPCIDRLCVGDVIYMVNNRCFTTQDSMAASLLSRESRIVLTFLRPAGNYVVNTTPKSSGFSSRSSFKSINNRVGPLVHPIVNASPLISLKADSLNLKSSFYFNADGSAKSAVALGESYAPQDEIKRNEISAGKHGDVVEVAITNVTQSELGLVLGQCTDAVCGTQRVARLVVQQFRRLDDGKEGPCKDKLKLGDVIFMVNNKCFTTQEAMAASLFSRESHVVLTILRSNRKVL